MKFVFLIFVVFFLLLYLEEGDKRVWYPRRPVRLLQTPTSVIVIPYRDRAVHYEKLVQNLPKPVILVEQGDRDHFQRGWLLNIGISEVKKRFNNDHICVVTHDVDMIGENINYSWCDKPTQICSELSCFGGGLPYSTSAGGVVQASLKDWYAINGFTNTVKGWGGEDDDLHHRFRIAGLLDSGHLRRPQKGNGKCHCLHDSDHTERKKHPQSYGNILGKITRMVGGSDEWKSDGLNSLRYYIVDELIDKYGTIRIKVQRASRIWTCGHGDETKQLYDYALSDQTWGGTYKGHSEVGDILLYDWGPCADAHNFKGKILWFDGEDRAVSIRPGDVYFGGKPQGVDWVYSATAAIILGMDWSKPKEIGSDFLLYFNGNCVPFREKAFDKIGGTSVKGKCHGSKRGKEIVVDTHGWKNNVQYYKNYRFALVMENAVAPGYITEKIVLAFKAGCIPVYYGHRKTVEKWFNKNAFIFYDINNPEPALKKIRELENDSSAYLKMRSRHAITNHVLWSSLRLKIRENVLVQS